MLTSPSALNLTAVAGASTRVNDELKARYRDKSLDNGVPFSRATNLTLCRYFAVQTEFKLAGTSGSVRKAASPWRCSPSPCA